MNPKICIIIINWNGLKDTSECLESLKKVDYKNFVVIIVDNNSFGNDVEIIKKEFGDFVKEIIVSKVNLGFSGGNNLGIKYALENGADFILLLNNDTIVEPDFLTILLDTFNKCKNAGVSAPQINYYNNKNIVWSVGGQISKIRGSGFAYSDENENQIEKKIREVNFASGCCLLIRKEVFEKIGMLDEKFFLYVEDTDFCFRTIKAGFKIIINPNSKIYHKVGNSTSINLKQIPLYYETRNRLYFAKKNFNIFFIITFLYIFVTMIYKSIIWFLNGKSENITSIKLAFRDFIEGNFGKLNKDKLLASK
ncbi:MAG: glycosyltransferase family 2 protein [Ignavibacteriae bacterium]|nr:glycosyltransferase family 2 protein [Ignavibacteriota bacterium]